MATAIRCFHRGLSGVAAADVLSCDGRDGVFLVRPSSRGSLGQIYAISVRWRGDVFHVSVSNEGDYYEIYGIPETFASLADLIEHCVSRPDFLTTDNKLRLPRGLRLQHPLPSPDFDVGKEKWMHDALGLRQDAEAFVNKHGVPGSYIVRPSKTQPENFVFSIMTESHSIVHVPIKSDKDNRYSLDGATNKHGDLRSLVAKCQQGAMIKTALGFVPLRFPLPNTAFLASEAAEVASKLARLGGVGFFGQFEDLALEDYAGISYDEAGREGNKLKNRYKNILPFDQTRVILRQSGSGGGGYINASRVKPPMGNPFHEYAVNEAAPPPRCYVAAQGPLVRTEVDFWRMIVQENSRVIVMLTREKEGEKKKCSRYWPENKDSDKILNDGATTIRVRLLHVRKSNAYVVRHLEWTLETPPNSGAPTSSVTSQTVWQYHFVAWPDAGVPRDPATVLEYLWDAHAAQEELGAEAGPVIVHCSAGIGRTGTFIALDCLLSGLREGGETSAPLDIYHLVKLLRRQRFGMIQTPEQFRFVYEAIAVHVEAAGKRRRAADVEGNYVNVTF